MTDYSALDLDKLQQMVADMKAAKQEDAAFAEATMALSGKYAEASLPERALDAAVDGVSTLRELHNADPAQYGVHLASALNNMSNRLSDLARDDEARSAGDEAVELGRAAVEHAPAEARLVLISALMNQSGRSWRAGQSLRAIEELGTGVDIFRQGGEALYSFLDFMVDVLHKNAMALAEGNLWEEALAVRRMVGQLFPEDQIPLAVMHLQALTMQQAAAAKCREGFFTEALPLAEDATNLARDLAETAPEQYALFLAQSLAALAGRLHEAGAHELALEPAVEAVGSLQELVKVDPAGALEPLVPTLDTFISILNVLGHEQQAQTIKGERDKLAQALELMQGSA
ncbi:MAG: tetratricopeptide repeat protein [Magnetospirillum gryphiswaldense]|nr:tetratricopeptide repeat protein [Magnetospirillum gryphiswaldense]